VRKFLQTLYSTVHYYLTQIADLDAYVQNRPRLANYDLKDVTIKLAEAEDFQQLTKTMDKFRTSTRVADRRARDDLCVVAYKHDTLVHARWAALTPIPMWGGDTLYLDPDEAYTYDSYTIPAFRGQGISSEARVFLIKYLASQGVHRTYTTSRSDNVITQQHRSKRLREGRMRILGLITVTRRLGWTYCSYSTETSATRSLMARLFHIPLQKIQLHSSSS
jgi:hypothetical protein